MAEAEDDAQTPDTGDFTAMSGAEQEPAPDAEAVSDEPESPPAPTGPGKLRLALRWFSRWHPYIFMAAALCLAVVAWRVYPESETRKITPPELFYYDGLDRLYRVMNPDLSLVAGSPADEALAARNAFLNLFVFHRENLRNHPEFVNPHLLLAEANRLLAEFNPAMARKYYTDAAAAYADAALWEGREDSPGHRAVYAIHNFLNGEGNPDTVLADQADEIALRRTRRMEYIRFRQAEADVNLGRPEIARAALTDLRRTADSRRRDDLRRTLAEDVGAGRAPRHAFELGPDDFRRLDLLLARALDGLGLQDQAKGWYLRYLANVPDGRSHAFVVRRLADIALETGEVYRRVDPRQAAEAYATAEGYYRELGASPSAGREDYEAAVLGQAAANSRLAELVEAGEPTGVDELSDLGRWIRGRLEGFSGQPLPRRALAIPQAAGRLLAKPETIVPGLATFPEAIGGTFLAMAGGDMITPREKRRGYLLRALEFYDRIAGARAGTEAGDRAAVQAAREVWNLGRKEETEARLERLMDPLSSEDLILAARLGLARVALDRGELRRAHMLLLGGYAHPHALWLMPADADWRKIAARLGLPSSRAQPGVWRRVWESLSPEGRDIALYAASGRRLDDDYVRRFLRALNSMIRRPDLYREEDFPAPDNRNPHLAYLLGRHRDLLTPEDVIWRNRLLLEEAWPYDLSQRGAKDTIGFEPMPPVRAIAPGGLLDAELLGATLLELARAWNRAAAQSPADRVRDLMESVAAYQAALEHHDSDPGEALYELAGVYEALADMREGQGDHPEAILLTTRAGHAYLDVSLLARGSPREMEALLAAGDAFFRSGRLEWTVESQRRFLERFGYTARPGTDGAMAVVRAENLLGRAQWFMNDTESALEAFRRNIPRRTPDRFKSIYYIGRILLEEGMFKNDPALLGSLDNPLPALDRYGDPIIETALQAFNFLRQSQGINPTARAWRWATFDLAKLSRVFAANARRQARDSGPADAGAAPAPAGEGGDLAWIGLYDQSRTLLTEALERYPLRRNGGPGVSVRVEPEDYADVMAARFETEYLLADTLLVLADARGEEPLFALARAHLENLRDRGRYAAALFDTGLDRFQLNSAVIREEIEGGGWDRSQPLPRARLGDDEGPTRDPAQLRNMLVNSMLLLATEYFRAGEKASGRLPGAAAGTDAQAAGGYYHSAHRVYQDIYDRFGMAYGPQCLVGMGDSLARLGYRDDAANHYRMARNMAGLLPEDTRPDGLLDIGPAFWGRIASERLADMEAGYAVP